MPAEGARPRRGSVVVPAHNEARVIGAALSALDGHDLQVVVAANGCTDDTTEQARGHTDTVVLDLPEPSKRAALNAADRAVDAFPRVYLDADVRLEPGTVEALLAAADTEQPVLAVAPARFETSRSTWPVRAFYRVFADLPYVRAGYSSGVFVLSRSGRARFGEFPDQDGDDLFVQRLFAPGETVVVGGHSVVQAPHDLTRLLRIRTRVARGNRALAGHDKDDDRFAPSTRATLTALARLVTRRPARLPDALVYVAVTLAARRRAAAAPAAAWERDDSTR